VTPKERIISEIPTSQFARIRAWVKYEMSVAQVVGIYGVAVDVIERILRQTGRVDSSTKGAAHQLAAMADPERARRAGEHVVLVQRPLLASPATRSRPNGLLSPRGRRAKGFPDSTGARFTIVCFTYVYRVLRSLIRS
jgi:hypothetical protein